MNTLSQIIPGVGGQELIIILVVVLILFGAKKIPEFAKGLGKASGEFKKAKQEFESEIVRAEKSVSEEEEKKKEEA